MRCNVSLKQLNWYKGCEQNEANGVKGGGSLNSFPTGSGPSLPTGNQTAPSGRLKSLKIPPPPWQRVGISRVFLG